jgi:SNF2 family DNA or RNA helicase
VFSQFVSILTLLRNELEDQEIDYCYLDGSTRNRMDVVDRFQNNETIPVFLISLKAGGVGLNLTGADTVIHFDPWWNPAAEAQATDRAHRIGQNKVVTSYKLIVSNSVEERVLQMQNTKRRLLEEIFEASEANNSKIGLEDLRLLLR